MEMVQVVVDEELAVTPATRLFEHAAAWREATEIADAAGVSREYLYGPCA